MENSKFVVGLLESILGKGKPDKNKMDYAFSCPFCKHRKPKLIINVVTGQYHCWTCHPETKGKSPISLLKKLEASPESIREMASYFKGERVNLKDYKPTKVSLPIEYIPLSKENKSLEYRKAIVYLKSRNIGLSEIKKYDIGYCEKGKYANKIIIPSYDSNGNINYFIARSFEKEPTQVYDAPSCSKTDIIGFENLINWKVPVILCEGSFDAIAIKRNAIPLFGKSIPKALMMKLVQSDVKTVYLALDNDALKEAMTYAEDLLNRGKEVYLMELEGKDPSKIGFETMTKLLHKAQPITFTDLLIKKMQLL